MASPPQPPYPKLPPHLKAQLDSITPSVEPILKLAYYPCLVTLTDGKLLDRVYLVSEAPWIKLWGVYPSQDQGKAEVSISDIVSVADSPSRLPPGFANKLYESGESGMGYTVFTVVFEGAVPSLRSQHAYVAGGAVDFIDYPEGLGPKDIISVLPHVGRDSDYSNAPEYYWCLYSE
jgi:hypothetical protein